jgi:hypothetical protein
MVAEHAAVMVDCRIIDPIPHAGRELNKRVETMIPRLAGTLNLFGSFSHARQVKGLFGDAHQTSG